MKFLKVFLITWCFNAIAGLPPISSKLNGESVYSATFKTDLGFIKGTRSGTGLTINSLGAATGDSLTLGGTINANAILDAQSTTKAFMPPRMTTAQKNAIASPTAGMQVFDTTLNSMSYYDGTAWGFGVGNLILDNVYSGQVSAAGVISNTNKTFFSSCSQSLGVATCTISSLLGLTLPELTIVL